MAKLISRSIASAAGTSLLALSALCMASNAHAETEYRVGGYIKADFMFSNFSDGNLDSMSIGRDFYIPGLTPIGGDSNTVTDFHARESRFFFEATQTLENGDDITGYFEFDFLGTAGGDKRITNSYSPRMRHAFIRYNNWTFGQFWSNFQDLANIPEAPDFVGIADGTVFNRQTQVRYTNGAWSFSLEQPETTVTPYLGGNARITTGDSVVPDITAKYTGSTAGGIHYSLAGIFRQLEMRQGGVDDTEAAFGISAVTRIPLGDNDIRASVVTGSGVGRYVGINVVNGAVLDEQFNLNAIDVTGVTFAYRHIWTDKVRTNLIFSGAYIDNPEDLTGVTANESTQRVAANLFYQVNERLVLSGEISSATRTLINEDDGSLNRLQFSAQYAF